MALGYLSFFLILGMKGYWFNKENIDWLYLLIIISLGSTFIVYKVVTYKKTLTYKRIIEQHEIGNWDLEKFKESMKYDEELKGAQSSTSSRGIC
jgi:hypothetical protein